MSEADNKTSDKNVANIEEDIKYVKEMLEIARVFFKAVKAETNYKDVDDVAFCNAVEHILAEREQKDKRIQELEEENEELLEVKISCSVVNIIENLQKENESKQKAYDDCYCEYKKYKQFESIPKQVVIDKIKDNNQILDETKDGDIRKRLYIENEILQELLEGGK